MAGPERLATNVDGPFYVNSACINCDQCRQLAPEVFAEVGHYSAVRHQPAGPDEARRALHALLSCPTGAIVSDANGGLQDAVSDFPLRIAENIYYCGFTSRHSYGASSYLIVHPEGNWMVDSPRWTPRLVQKMEEMGGIGTIFLSHQDDVADAAKYAERFGAERIIHRLELHAQPGAEQVIEGFETHCRSADFRIIPTPGHTRGHMALLYKETYLFTGDHLAWDRDTGELTGHPDVCWFDWKEQTRSMERLAKETFEWILPGHGDRIRLPRAEMRAAMDRLAEHMKSGR